MTTTMKIKKAPFYANCVDCAREGVRTPTNLSWIGKFLCKLHIEDRETIQGVNKTPEPLSANKPKG